MTRRQFQIDELYNGDVKQMYLFSKENTPAFISSLFKDKINDYTCLAIYRYHDDTFNIAFSLLDENDDYKDTCEYICKEYKRAIKKNHIEVITDDDLYDDSYFNKFNLKRIYYA